MFTRRGVIWQVKGAFGVGFNNAYVIWSISKVPIVANSALVSPAISVLCEDKLCSQSPLYSEVVPDTSDKLEPAVTASVLQNWLCWTCTKVVRPREGSKFLKYKTQRK